MRDIKINASCGILVIEGALEDKWEEMYLDIFSDRNQKISKMSDVSEYDTTCNEEIRESLKKLGNDENEALEGDYEIWYPVVDLHLDSDMEGIICMDGAGKCSLNRSLSLQLADQETEIVVPSSAMEHWENILITEGKGIVCRSFMIRKCLDNSRNKICEQFKLLSHQWSGTVRLWGRAGSGAELLWEGSIETSVSSSEAIEFQQNHDRLMGALKDDVDYILRNQIKKEGSLFDGGVYLFYDHDAKTFRQPSWIWTWGTAIHLLLEADKVSTIRDEYEPGHLLRVAQEIGEASLRFQKTDDSTHPAYGLVTCRMDYDSRLKGGYMEFLSPPDSLFLAGWGWMSLYRATGDIQYLKATQLLVGETGRILKMNEDIIEQDYMIPAEEWKDWILDEAGFGMKGVTQLHACDPADEWKEIGRVYIEQNLAIFEREDGLWDRMWTRSTQTLTKTEYHTRGAGWAMEGVLSAWELLEDETYLDKAMKMADRMIEAQNPDGSWSFEFDKKPEVYGYSEKGTAYWSGLMYRLYKFRSMNQYLEAAQKALDWCLKNQYRGLDSDGYGGIIGRSPNSGVVYRKFFDLSCTYTAAFFGEAIMMEMNRSRE